MNPNSIYSKFSFFMLEKTDLSKIFDSGYYKTSKVSFFVESILNTLEIFLK